MIERVYTVLFPFCGVGGGALGFKLAVADLARPMPTHEGA